MPSLSGWSEGILLSVLLVLMIGVVVGNLNLMYSQDYQTGLGANATQTAFTNYQDTLESEIKSGEADFSSSSGLTIKSSWNIIKTGGTIIWDFFTGGWIEKSFSYMRIHPNVALIVRILYFLSMGYIILKLLFKVKP